MCAASRLSVIACVVVGLFVSAVCASPILPGQTIVQFSAEPDPVGGVLVAPILTLPFVTGTFSGTLTSMVISGDTTNALGGLTFVYTITNDAKGPDAIHRLTVNGYTGFLTDGSYQAAAGQKPTTIDRGANGDVIGFGFIGAPLGFGELPPGAPSTPLVVQTNAPAYRETFASVIDGTVTTVRTYSPVIPEPVTLGLMAIGMGLVLVRRH